MYFKIHNIHHVFWYKTLYYALVQICAYVRHSILSLNATDLGPRARCNTVVRTQKEDSSKQIYVRKTEIQKAANRQPHIHTY